MSAGRSQHTATSSIRRRQEAERAVAEERDRAPTLIFVKTLSQKLGWHLKDLQTPNQRTAQIEQEGGKTGGRQLKNPLCHGSDFVKTRCVSHNFLTERSMISLM